MSFYAIFLGLHSWVRWLLVVAALALLIRSIYGVRSKSAYDPVDERLALVLFWALNIQFVLGLTMYLFFSPTVQIAMGDLSAAFADAKLRFFLVEHPIAMFLAVGAGHSGLKKAKKAMEARDKHVQILKGVGGCFFFLMIGIPWPFLPYGRALFFV